LVCGLIGAGIQGSRSPALHEQEGAAQGLRYVYRRIDLDVLRLGNEALPELVLAAERMGFAGLNVTYPAKQAIIPLLSELSEDSRALGAVNTVVLKEGKRIGHNTDCTGFSAAFRRGLPDAKRDAVVQLGAGGAGAAVAHAAVALGVGKLMIFDVDGRKASALAAKYPGRAVAVEDAAEALRGADGLIHCTPTGMASMPGIAIAPELLKPSQWVADIVYVPLETGLLKAARARGCRTLDGGGMAVFQAAAAFELFTGKKADAERMLRHFAAMV
jgi:shikimate dehydrogenase